MTTTITMPYDPEPYGLRVAQLFKDCGGGTEGFIGKVTLGNRNVDVPPAPPPAAATAGPKGSYMARMASGLPVVRFSPPAAERALLLDMIHRYHLQALASANSSGGAARSRVARGMLFAGYTYGSLPDPVSNILANALWYDAKFPPPAAAAAAADDDDDDAAAADAITVKMLSAKAMFRMACRSLDALLAFVAAYAPLLPLDQRWSCLLAARGDLQHAIHLISVSAESGSSSSSKQRAIAMAFRAAIRASDLPNEAAREAHLSFVTSHDSARDLLHDRCFMINPSVFRVLVPPLRRHYQPLRMRRKALATPGLAAATSSEPPRLLSSLSQPAYRALRLKMHSFRMEEELSLDIVALALRKLALQHGVSYKLHMACGKNSLILAPETYYHVNFLASPEGDSNPPTLFFAEVRATLEDANDVTLCCPLSDVTGRCFACEYNGVKLVHPADVKFNGDEDRIGDYRLMTDPTSDFGAPLNEDYVFFELDKHPVTAAFLEANYSFMNDDQIDLSFYWFEDYLP